MSQGDFMSDKPDRLYIDKKDRKLYDELKEKEMIFKSMKNKDLFILAMLIGFQNDKISLENKDGYFLVKDLNENDKAIINAIATTDSKHIEILRKTSEVYTIAEEYAHYGIKVIYDWVNKTPYGLFSRDFEKELVKKYQDIL